jgi:hypothetical protein
MIKYLWRYAYSLLSGYGPCNVVGKLNRVSGLGHRARPSFLFGSDEERMRVGVGSRPCLALTLVIRVSGHELVCNYVTVFTIVLFVYVTAPALDLYW